MRSVGGWLVWQWWRNGASPLLGLLGAVMLVLYGVVPTFQSPHFGRVYAAYGGVFVVLSVLWGWGVDGDGPIGSMSSVLFCAWPGSVS